MYFTPPPGLAKTTSQDHVCARMLPRRVACWPARPHEIHFLSVTSGATRQSIGEHCTDHTLEIHPHPCCSCVLFSATALRPRSISRGDLGSSPTYSLVIVNSSAFYNFGDATKSASRFSSLQVVKLCQLLLCGVATVRDVVVYGRQTSPHL